MEGSAFEKPGAIIPMANPNNNSQQINQALRIYEYIQRKLFPLQRMMMMALLKNNTRAEHSPTPLLRWDSPDNVTMHIEPGKGSFDGL